MLTADAIEKLAEFVQAGKAVETPDGGQGYVLPREFMLTTLPPVEPPLPRIVQRPVFHDEASFVGYVKAFKSDATRVFAEPGFIAGTPHVTAVIDYHQAGVPDRLAHIATYRPRYANQWAVWTKAEPMDQPTFAEFIEENRKDIRTPSAAELLDIVRNFKASKKHDYDSVVYQPNGDVKLAYAETTDAQGSVSVPDQLELGIPVYFRGTVYSVPVFVRYRLAGPKLSFTLKVDRADVIEDDAFTEMVARIGEAIEIPAYIGTQGRSD